MTSLPYLPQPFKFTGQVSKPLVVLATSELRLAKLKTIEETVTTADGIVKTRPGDVEITAYSGETYPIKREIFDGGYQVLWGAGDQKVARRLVQKRLAWPISSDTAKFDYGPDRGEVEVSKGSWLYQSDQLDFGAINATANTVGHLILGPVDELQRRDYASQLENLRWFLAVLPAVLSVLAVGGFVLAKQSSNAVLVHWMLLGEIALLGLAAFFIRRSKTQAWVAKGCAQLGASACQRFQCVVRLLGQMESVEFSEMAIWRAANANGTSINGSQLLANTKEHEQLLQSLNTEIEQRDHNVHLAHLIEGWADGSALLAMVLMLCLSVALLFSHNSWLHFAALVLPALVGSLHLVARNSQSVQIANAAQELSERLKFLRAQLTKPRPESDVTELLRAVCGAVGGYSQAELQRAMSLKVPIPV